MKTVEQRKLKKREVPELRIFLGVIGLEYDVLVVFVRAWNPSHHVIFVGICEALRKQNSEPKGHSSGWGNHARWFLRPQCEEGCRSKKHLSIPGRFLAKNWCLGTTVPSYHRFHMFVNYSSLRWIVFSRTIHFALGLRNLPLPRRTVWPFRIIWMRPTNKNA